MSLRQNKHIALPNVVIFPIPKNMQGIKKNVLQPHILFLLWLLLHGK